MLRIGVYFKFISQNLPYVDKIFVCCRYSGNRINGRCRLALCILFTKCFL